MKNKTDRTFKAVIEAEVTIEAGVGIKILRAKDSTIIGFTTKDGRAVKPVLNFKVSTPCGFLADVAKLQNPRIEVTGIPSRVLSLA